MKIVKKIFNNNEKTYFKAFIQEFENEKASKKPLVIVCPGGGYIKCAPREMDIVASEFLNEGYHSIVLKYSAYETDKEFEFAKQLKQLAFTYKWVIENSESNFIDAKRIHILGFSAGGNLVANFATHFFNEKLINQKFTTSDKIRTVLLGYPRISYEDLIIDNNTKKDLSKMTVQEKNNFDMIQNKKETIFGTITPSADQVITLSPILNVDKNFPPSFLFQAGDDDLTKKADFLKFLNKLNEEEIEFESHLFAVGGHGFSILGASDELSDSGSNVSSMRSEEVNNSLKSWVQLAKNWIKYNNSL